MKDDAYFLQLAIDLAREGMRLGAGGPFGALIVRDEAIIGRGYNQVLELGDPTAHAEVVAIRDACARIGHFQLDGAVLYTSCEPCPMCLGAIFWARPDRVVYAASHEDAAQAGFDDRFIYEQIQVEPALRRIPFTRMLPQEGRQPFEEWRKMPDKKLY